MKIFYHKSTDWRWKPTLPKPEKDFLALSYNDFDDYGIGTTLNAVLYFEGKEFHNFSVKLLIENDTFSSGKLNALREKGWDGYFPIPELNYVSVPSDIDFYSTLIAKKGQEIAMEVLEALRDASYLANIRKDKAAIVLTQTNEFATSLLREAGSRKAFEDGWLSFTQRDSQIHDFMLNILDKSGSVEPISFRFNSEMLPYDINILIGPNGIGKSFALRSMVEYWLGVGAGSKPELEKKKHTPFDRHPNLSKLILISYSPFEDFPLDLNQTDLKDKEAYKYFGFRKLRTNIDNNLHIKQDGNDPIGISRNLPAMDSVQSIIKALTDDKKMGFLPHWRNKFDTISAVLLPAIGFDRIALDLIQDLPIPQFGGYIEVEGSKYLPIDQACFNVLNDWNIDLEHYINFTSGVIFLRNGERIDLSSGQRLFCYIVVNVVGQIRTDSLIVIDEPELFLHPTLEIEFIALLKKVLTAFKSKAILATHSLAIAREVPANCIHVFHKRDAKVEIENPPFETFGGDMQRISSYVFGDKSVSKPFDEWIESKIKDYDRPEALLKKLGAELNEELMIKILNSGEQGDC